MGVVRRFLVVMIKVIKSICILSIQQFRPQLFFFLGNESSFTDDLCWLHLSVAIND